jgi:hypothetical protein
LANRVGLLTTLFVLNVGHRFDEGAIVTAVVVVALLARRGDFRLRRPESARVSCTQWSRRRRSSRLVALWVNRLMADQPYTIPFALRVTARALAGMSFRGADHLSGAVAEWFPIATFFYAMLARLRRGRTPIIFTEHGRHFPDLPRPKRKMANRMLLRRRDRVPSSSRSASRRSSRTESSAALRSSPRSDRPSVGVHGLVRRFLDFAHERGWRVAVLGVSEASLDVHRSLGLHALYHGDEAVVETATFSLEGRAIRKVRQSVHRLQAAGFSICTLRPSKIGGDLRVELEQIAREWRGDAPERGFVMAIDALFRLGDDDALLSSASTATAGLQASCTSPLPAPARRSPSSMPRRRDVPNGFTEWLICGSIEWARANRLARVSLNFAPFAALLSPDAELTRGSGPRPPRSGAEGLVPARQPAPLQSQVPPDVGAAFRRLRAARSPRVGVAALAAESYLPFQ